MHEQSKLILNVRAAAFTSKFGALPGAQPCVIPIEHPVMKAMIGIMIPIAEAYGRDELKVEELVSTKDKAMENCLGLRPGSQ